MHWERGGRTRVVSSVGWVLGPVESDFIISYRGCHLPQAALTNASRESSFIHPTPSNPMYAEISFKSTDAVQYTCVHPNIGVTTVRYTKAKGMRSVLPSRFARLQRTAALGTIE
jgi:hypothetical protein